MLLTAATLMVLPLSGCQTPEPDAAPATPTPVRWATPGLTVHRTPEPGAASATIELDREAFVEARALLQDAAAVVPPGYFERHPLRIYALASMRAPGVSTGRPAWSEPGVVWVVVPRGDGVIDEGKLRRRFYVELGRALYARHQREFRPEDWLAANPSGFAHSGAQWSEAGTSFELLFGEPEDPAVARRSVELEDEVATYIAMLLAREPGLAQAREVSEMVDTKARLAEAFLQRVDPGFTAAWLAGLKSSP